MKNDLEALLKRRRISVGMFLNQEQIFSMPMFNAWVKTNEKDITVTETFTKAVSAMLKGSTAVSHKEETEEKKMVEEEEVTSSTNIEDLRAAKSSAKKMLKNVPDVKGVQIDGQNLKVLVSSEEGSKNVPDEVDGIPVVIELKKEKE